MNDNLGFSLVKAVRRLNATLLAVVLLLLLQWALAFVAFLYFAQPATP